MILRWLRTYYRINWYECKIGSYQNHIENYLHKIFWRIIDYDGLPINFIELIVKINNLPDKGHSKPKSTFNLNYAKVRKLSKVEWYLTTN